MRDEYFTHKNLGSDAMSRLDPNAQTSLACACPASNGVVSVSINALEKRRKGWNPKSIEMAETSQTLGVKESFWERVK